MISYQSNVIIKLYIILKYFQINLCLEFVLKYWSRGGGLAKRKRSHKAGSHCPRARPTVSSRCWLLEAAGAQLCCLTDSRFPCDLFCWGGLQDSDLSPCQIWTFQMNHFAAVTPGVQTLNIHQTLSVSKACHFPVCLVHLTLKCC